MKIITALSLALSLSASVQAQDDAAFHDEFASLLKKEQVVGAQLVLFNRQGVQQSWSFGEASPGQAVSNQTLFRAGSTTKTLTAMAVMQLVAQHKFALHDDVKQLEPALLLNNPYQAQQPVQVIHLLEHTAGLDDMHFRNFYNVNEPDIDALNAVNRDSAALTVRWLPGTRHAYSNPGYGILGHLVARYSGQPFEQYVTEHLLKPLHMQQCQVVAGNHEPAGLSQGYDAGNAVTYRQIYLRSAGNLVCNAEGLASMARYLLTNGADMPLPGLDAAVIQQMETPETTLAAKAGLHYGYGKAIYHATRADQEWLSHNGGIDGFTTSYAYSRQTGLGYVLMVNSSSANFGELTKAIAKHLSPAAAPAATTTAHNQLPMIAPIAGYYRVADERNEIFAGLSSAFAVVKLIPTADGVTMSPLLGTDEVYETRGGALLSKAGRSHATGISLPNTELGNAFQVDGQFFLQTSAFSAWGTLVLVMAGLCSMALALLYAPVWLVNRKRGRVEAGGQVQLRFAPLCYSLTVGGIALALMQHSLFTVSQLNWQNVTVLVGTLLLPVICLWQCWSAWRFAAASSSRFARVFAWFSAASHSLLTLYFASYGYIGLRLWAW